ncbi:MAG: hypothetical protein HY282_01265 [Nitrospirae bacterium]|nr:hypothetical protein [Candidatus Manganitrophaceae bacterium]
MASSWELGAFIIGSLSMSVLVALAHSIISIDRNLKERQARMRKMGSI